MENLKAKEIFFNNDGHKYHMAHDGFYDEYRKYNIDEVTEKRWIEELIQVRLNEFKCSSDIRYLIPLVDYNTYYLLDELSDVKLKGTYINKFAALELLVKLLHKNKGKIENYKAKRIRLVDAFNELLELNIPKKYGGYRIDERIEKMKKKLNIKN